MKFRIYHQHAATARENWRGEASQALEAFTLTAVYHPAQLTWETSGAFGFDSHRGYFLTAIIEAASFEDAYAKTQSIDKPWGGGRRSTMVGDIIANERGDVQMVARIGFAKLLPALQPLTGSSLHATASDA